MIPSRRKRVGLDDLSIEKKRGEKKMKYTYEGKDFLGGKRRG